MSPSGRWKTPLVVIAGVAGLALIFLAGLELRRATWRATEPIRYVGDVYNGFYWGSEVVAEGRRLNAERMPESAREGWVQFAQGYHGLYDRVTEWYSDGRYYLDYPPLRLLVMGLWAKHVLGKHPDLVQGDPAHTGPLRLLNLLCEALTAAGIFALVAIVRARERRAWMGVAFLAALLVWFNPALILDAHGWPQWDVWLLPGFVMAAVFATLRRWFWCGAALAVGGLLKGQILLVAPFFLLWPLFQRDFWGAFHVLTGMLATVALITAHWLAESWAVFGGVAAVGAIIGCLWFRLRPSLRSHTGVVMAFGMAIALFLAPHVVPGSYAWLKVGFLFGTRNYEALAIGSANNLAGLMAGWGWVLRDTMLGIPLSVVLQGLYAVALALCAWAAARHHREGGSQLLLAIATPWIVMFAFLGQMHERYLLWGAVMTAVGAAFGIRGVLLHLGTTLMATAMIFHVMLAKVGATESWWFQFFQGFHPSAGWIVIALAVIYLAMSLRRSRTRLSDSEPTILRT